MRRDSPRVSRPQMHSLYDSPFDFIATRPSLPKRFRDNIPLLRQNNNSFSLFDSPLYDFCNIIPPTANKPYENLHQSPSTSAKSSNATTFPLSTRKPKQGDSVTPNPLRPHVLAKHRIHAWKTPYAIEKRSQATVSLPPKVIDLGEKVMSEALADSSKSSYAAGLLRFNQFCDNLNISEEFRMPACEDLIIGFIGNHMGDVASVNGWLSGLRAWHDLHGAPWPSESRKIRYARAGARKAGSHRRRPIRNPITLAHMLALFLALDFHIPFHCSIWAIACNAFWGCRRLGKSSFII